MVDFIDRTTGLAPALLPPTAGDDPPLVDNDAAHWKFSPGQGLSCLGQGLFHVCLMAVHDDLFCGTGKNSIDKSWPTSQLVKVPVIAGQREVLFFG